MGNVENMVSIGLSVIVLIPAAYLIVRAGAHAYFRTKREHLRKTMQIVNEELKETDHGI